jgi:hypothetical protein
VIDMSRDFPGLAQQLLGPRGWSDNNDSDPPPARQNRPFRRDGSAGDYDVHRVDREAVAVRVPLVFDQFP